jgi:hypothetical protein
MQNPRAIVLALLSIAAFADGIVHQLTAPGEMYARSDIVFTLVAALLIFLWYRLDSDQMAYRRSPWLNVAVVAIGIIALPYYFFRSRGLARGAIAVGLFLLSFVIYVVLPERGRVCRLLCVSELTSG